TECAEAVGLHVPDALLIRVPNAAGSSARTGGQVRGGGRIGTLIGNVVVFIPDEEVGVASPVGAVGAAAGAIQVGPVLIVSFDDRIGRDGGRDDVALRGIFVDDDVDLGHGIPVDDVERDAV